jgi:hypothetical protein
MTQRDYIAVAEMIHQRRDEIESDQKFFTESQDKDKIIAQDLESRLHETTIFAERMAGLFAQDNSRFDKALFLKACGGWD